MHTTIEFTPASNLNSQSKIYGRVKICSGDIWVNATVIKANNQFGFFIAMPSDQDKNDKSKYWPKAGFIDRSVQGSLEQQIAPLVQQSIMNASGQYQQPVYQQPQGYAQQQPLYNPAPQQPEGRYSNSEPAPSNTPFVPNNGQVPPAVVQNVQMGPGVASGRPNPNPATARRNPMNNPMMRK